MSTHEPPTTFLISIRRRTGSDIPNRPQQYYATTSDGADSFINKISPATRFKTIYDAQRIAARLTQENPDLEFQVGPAPRFTAEPLRC